MAMSMRDLTVPDDATATAASQAATRFAAYLRTHPTPSGRVKLCTEDAPDTPIMVPAEAFRLFIELLDELAKGNAVTIAPVTAELTTQQAADLLGVSRPYLIKLVERDEIPCRRVGNRRKLRLTDVLHYQRKDDERRREIVRELTQEAEELGLYD